jgi:hypothetical protein
MADLATTVHNIPPANVAKMLRGRYQWSAYQALASVSGEWITADDLARATYGDTLGQSWEPLKALTGVIHRLRRKGVPVLTQYFPATYSTRYSLPLAWQREQDAATQAPADEQGVRP